MVSGYADLWTCQSRLLGQKRKNGEVGLDRRDARPYPARVHFDVDPCTIGLCVLGSHAYGMGTPQSDVDIRGVCIPPRTIRNSFHKTFEQWQSPAQVGSWGPKSEYALSQLDGTAADSYVTCASTADVTVFSLTKFVGLAAKANPNILELLFCADQHLLYSAPAWDELRAARQLFLSKKCMHTYSGYAHSQLHKIKGHRAWLLDPPARKPTRGDFGLPEESVLPANVRSAIDEATAATIRQWGVDEGLDEILTGAALDVLRERMVDFQQAVIGVNRDQLDDAIHEVAASSLGLSDGVLAAVKAERAYRQSSKHWQSYVQWQTNRNPARAEMEAKFGYDLKHASHLVRLMRTGTEILRDGDLRVLRPDADELLAIRKGAYTYEQVLEIAATEEAAMKAAMLTSRLPKTPDHEKIDAILLATLDRSP
ncbi:MAG: hypothetical protein E6R03_14950 [Hyphomicrobiaceae bacterium]|nr:MAG: hypothetical protein E6R03_14950 [Hyphomicrobiaceae bacterium]